MDSTATDNLRGHLRQTRVLKRVVLRKLLRAAHARENEQLQVDQLIASKFLEDPRLENVDELCVSFGYARVRRAIHLLDKMIFEEFFYGKLYFYPMWIKRYAQLFEAARPRQIVRELNSSHE
jgi:hypothetical protein